MFPRILHPLLWLLSATAAPADLVWEKAAQEFHRTPADIQLRTSFPFRNAGGKPVEIMRVATSCGCTAAKLEPRRYAPGAGGQIDVEFTFGARRGDQRKIITVTTDEGRQYALELRCFIEEPLTIRPALVFWRIGEPSEPKMVEITVNGASNLTITNVASPSEAILATLETVEPGKRYLVKVAPASTAQRQSVALTVSTDFPPDAPKCYTIFARVK